MHFFKDASQPHPTQYEILKKSIRDLSNKHWEYLPKDDKDTITIEEITLTTWSKSPPFMQERYRLILESLQKIDARLDAGNKDKLDDADILNLIEIAKYTLMSAPEAAFFQVEKPLEPEQTKAYKKTAEEIEQKFGQLPLKIIPNMIRNYLFDNNPYCILVDNVKKNIFKQSHMQEEDPDMYLTSKISSTIYKMLTS